MKLDYKGSGIKTLRGASVTFLIISIVMSLLLIPTWTSKDVYSDMIHWEMVGASLFISMCGMFVYGFGYAIATIAENSLMQKVKADKEELDL